MKLKQIKYVFLDVVSYTSQSIEDQATTVEALKQIVESAVGKYVKLLFLFENVTYLPTGDGICICIHPEDPDDLHILVALEILRLLNDHNLKEDPKFQVRIGINENKDIAYRDINDNVNFAGRGINHAQRIMSSGGPGQILVGSTVYEKLADRRDYRGKFRQHTAMIKNTKIDFYQYTDDQYVEFLDNGPIP